MLSNVKILLFEMSLINTSSKAVRFRISCFSPKHSSFYHSSSHVICPGHCVPELYRLVYVFYGGLHLVVRPLK